MVEFAYGALAGLIVGVVFGTLVLVAIGKEVFYRITKPREGQGTGPYMVGGAGTEMDTSGVSGGEGGESGEEAGDIGGGDGDAVVVEHGDEVDEEREIGL
ncbi:uncharacterized protein LY89DRAFT_740632 [Mollisia scopiformis]|uniref:Uncharacterized protein n=1 Tax=Mollisia scopiformis TaxID=149040 RepID=A0A132BD13_MOLSC|nr:uncharacterized protein LY89DRAFT_740632 [Mollisia scopiformis]KUJ09547.1 hypothetical protein LY89DRAFT_740632 [Mollisia scopiformis]